MLYDEHGATTRCHIHDVAFLQLIRVDLMQNDGKFELCVREHNVEVVIGVKSRCKIRVEKCPSNVNHFAMANR